jgi:transposase
MATRYLGVDVSKTSLTAATYSQQQGECELGEFAHTRAGFQQLAAAVGDSERLHLVVEPTGSYHLALVSFAYDQGWAVSLPNPQLVREWARGLGQRAKTDRLDARTLARYGAERQPSAQPPLPAAVAELERLLRRQQDLAQMAAQERNRRASLAYQAEEGEAIAISLNEMEQALSQAQAAMAAAIQEHVGRHPELKKERRRLLTVPGVGERNVLHLLVLLHRWQARSDGAGDAKGLTAYVGLDPVTVRSGSSLHPRSRISKMGNREWRRRLYLSALGGNRAQHSPLTVFYQRLLSRKKPKMVALIACARKILVWSWTVFRSGVNFDPAKAMPAHFGA